MRLSTAWRPRTAGRTERVPSLSYWSGWGSALCKRRGVPAIINRPGELIGLCQSSPVKGGHSQSHKQLTVSKSSPLLSPVLPLHLQTIKNYCNGFIDTANMHVRVEAVCILANTAHNAEDCLAIENVISSQHGDCKCWFSLLQLAGAHISQQWNVVI